MLRLSFALRGRPSKTDGLDRIRATYYIDGKRCRFDSDLRVHPKDWDKKKQRVKESATLTNKRKAINKALLRCEAKASKVTGKSLESITQLQADSFLVKLIAKESNRVSSEIDFLDFFKARINYEGFKKNTREKYASVYRDIKGDPNAKKLNWQHITVKWCDKWVDRMEKRGLVESSVGKNVAVLKAVMNAGRKADLHNNKAYKKFVAAKKSKEPRPKTWLKADEVAVLENADLSSATLTYARDYFMCGLKSGQRYSDWVKVMSNKAEITAAGTPVVRLYQQKTGTKVTVALCDTLLAIRERWAQGLIPIVSKTTLREHLIRLGELFKFDSLKNPKFGTDPHLPDHHKKKQKEYLTLSSHTSRRSFARSEWAKGVDLSDIQISLGHKKATQTTDYIGYDENETQDMVADARAKRSRV